MKTSVTGKQKPAKKRETVKKRSTTGTSRKGKRVQKSAGSVFDLVAMLAHDLESPLASMNYTLELMESGRFDDSNPLHKRLLEGAHVAVRRAETIITDMLTAAKSEETDLTVDWQEVNLVDIAESAVRMASPPAAQSAVNVTLDSPPANCQQVIVRADGQLVSRIVDNLIFNAIRHTPVGGNITVSIQCDSDDISLTVTDTGEGIQGVDPKKLFEKFGQIEYRKKKKHRGVGLGLFFCRLAAEALGAELFARNAPAGGAQFGVTFALSGSGQVK